MTTPEELKQARIGLAEWMGWTDAVWYQEALRSVLERMTEEQWNEFLIELCQLLNVIRKGDGPVRLYGDAIRAIWLAPVELQAIAAWRVVKGRGER